MQKTTIIQHLKKLASDADTGHVRSMLQITIKILEMSPRRIEGFISLISGFTDREVHKASSEKRGIPYRKKQSR